MDRFACFNLTLAVSAKAEIEASPIFTLLLTLRLLRDGSEVNNLARAESVRSLFEEKSSLEREVEFNNLFNRRGGLWNEERSSVVSESLKNR